LPLYVYYNSAGGGQQGCLGYPHLWIKYPEVEIAGEHQFFSGKVPRSTVFDIRGKKTIIGFNLIAVNIKY